MNIKNFDLNLLRVFAALERERNVSRAAAALGLTQPAISNALQRLRLQCGDPLFVRTSGGMQATPRAEQLAPLVRQALQLLDQSLVRPAAFDPAEITRRFRICMTDVGQMTLLPRLLARVHQVAPKVGIEIANLSHDSARQLETGEADLALGFTNDMRAGGFYQQKLFDEGFVCLVARDHPRVAERMTLAQLRQERHVKVILSATGHAIVDKFLERKGARREFALHVPTFLGLGQVVAASQLAAIVPQRLGAIFAAESRVRIVSLPVRFPSYVVNQYWHDRYHRDPGGAWLRSLVYEAANSLPLEAAGAASG
jgi:DNA-binding transcriptional LysR family regulator